MKNILVPCDFSTASEKALRFALEIAALSEGEITVLNVINLTPSYIQDLEVNPYYVNSMSFLADLKQDAVASFDEIKKKLGATTIPIKLIVEQGIVSQAVLKCTHQHQIDLVVMATEGANGLREVLVGSNTEKIVRSSPVPVFAIHKSQKVGQVKNIIFPTTIELRKEKLIERVKVLQTFFKARIHLLYIKTPESKQKDLDLKIGLENVAKFYGLTDFVTTVKHSKTEEDGIVKFARDLPFSIIAMSTHGHTGLTHLMLGSIAEDVVNHCSESVWTYAGSET